MIVDPLVSHNFRVHGPDNISENVNYVKFDFANKKLTMAVRATVISQSIHDIRQFIETNTLAISPKKHNNVEIFSIVFTGVTCVEHECKFDYSEKNAAIHILHMTFRDCHTIDPNIEEAQNNIPLDNNVLTPAEYMAALDARKAV